MAPVLEPPGILPVMCTRTSRTEVLSSASRRAPSTARAAPTEQTTARRCKLGTVDRMRERNQTISVWFWQRNVRYRTLLKTLAPGRPSPTSSGDVYVLASYPFARRGLV